MIPGVSELLIIAFVLVLLFGVKKLPELGTGIGEGLKNFKKGYRDAKSIDVTPEKDESNPDDLSSK